MTAKQNTLYWREWGAVSRVCKADGLPVPDRHELHAKALGKAKSHTKFTNAEFDRVLAEFRVWSQPGDVRAQLKQEAMPRTRALWGLEHELLPQLIVVLDGMPADPQPAFNRAMAYVVGIAERKFGTAEFGSLPETQLHQLYMTVAERVRARREKLGLSPEDVRRRAGLGVERTGDSGQRTGVSEVAAAVAEGDAF